MIIQKLANYEQLRKRWKADFKQACVSYGRTMLFANLLCAVSLKWILNWMAKQTPDALGLAWIADLNIPMLYLLQLPVGIILTMLLAFMTTGPRPNPSHVELNQALRRARGMSDEVSDSMDI